MWISASGRAVVLVHKLIHQFTMSQAEAGLSLQAIEDAKNTEELAALAERVPGFTLPQGTALNPKRWALTAAAMKAGVLIESQAAKLVATVPALQKQLNEELQAVQKQAAAAMAVAEKAAAAAAQAAAVLAEVQQRLAQVESKLAEAKEQQLEAADIAAQKEVAAHVVLFEAAGLAELEAMRNSPAQLKAKATEFLRNYFGEAFTAHSAFLLRKPEGKPAPLVIVLASEADKVALLRAARLRREQGRHDVQLAARLTRWQQQRRAALKPQLMQLKAGGVTVRFWQGHRLQRQDSKGWVDVPLAASTNASQATE